MAGPSSRSAEALIVTLALEDDPHYKMDLSRFVGPEGVRKQLNAAVLAWSSTENGCRRTSTARNIRRAIAAFLRWLEGWNEERQISEEKSVESLSDMTPFHLVRFKEDLKDRCSLRTSWDYYRDFARLLHFAPGVTKATRREASKRKAPYPIKISSVIRYSELEFTQLRNAARRTIEGAYARIIPNYNQSRTYKDPECHDRLRAVALHEVLLYGMPQTKEGMHVLGASPAAINKGGGERAARRHLFLTTDEALAAAVLLACHRGLNLSPIDQAPEPQEHGSTVLQLDLDKPRRGPSTRFWPEIFVEPSSNESQREKSSQALLRMIWEVTSPARMHLSLQNRSSDRLLVYWPNNWNAVKFGVPSWGARKKSLWIPADLNLDFQRLRRSVPGEGVAKEPTHHTPDTYLHYVRSDPVLLAEQHEEAALGVQKLRDHARAGLEVRILDDREADPATDAVLVNCSDPQRRPETGLPCTAGFYSFFDCLGCSNAATVPRLLPRQMAALQVLAELRDSMGEAWERRFARWYFVLVALVGRTTAAEQSAAEREASEHIPTVVAALRHEVPR